jgi:hypothetical protein
MEAGRGDTDYPDRQRLGRKYRSDQLGTTSESAGPQTVTNDRDRLCPVAVILVCKVATANGQTQYPEVLRRDGECPEVLAGLGDFHLRNPNPLEQVVRNYLSRNTAVENPKRRRVQCAERKARESHDAFGLWKW